MTTDEVRLRLRRKLEEAFGVDEADLLLDRPPGGWGDLVTNRSLERAFDAFRAEMRGEIRGEIADLRSELHRGFQEQARFVAMFVVASQGVVVAAVAAIGAALRFA